MIIILKELNVNIHLVQVVHQQIILKEKGQCEICLEECSIIRSSSICRSCENLYLSSHIKEGRIRIECPSCSHIYTREEILFLLSANEDLSERYKRFYADINGQSHIKTCPRCCAIKEIL